MIWIAVVSIAIAVACSLWALVVLVEILAYLFLNRKKDQ